MSKIVRINGNSTTRVSWPDGHEYAVWAVEVQASDGSWQLVSACFGGGSLAAATLIARTWEDESKIPSPLDAYDFIEKTDVEGREW